MTRRFSIGGVTLPNEAILLPDGIGGLTTNADGQLGSSTVILDDPLGMYDFAYLQQFVAEETECALARSYTGYVYGISTRRGDYKAGPQRVHTLTIGDLNYLLHLQPLYGAAAKRPAETADARLAWLMTQPGMAGIVFDNGLITSNTAMFGEEDLRNQYPNEVLASICVAGIGSRIFYLTWDESAAAGEEVTLFYAEPDSILAASTLAVSNILASIDGLTILPPYLDSELDAQGEEIYCGLWLTYGGRGDRLFTHNDATHAAYFTDTSPPGLHRIGTLTLDRVGELDTAQHHSDVWLNLHSGALKTLSYTLRLPSDQVNFVNAGMLIPNELSHLMGFETPETWRVTERTLVLTADTHGEGQVQFYDLALKLSVTGGRIPGGGGGGLPHVPNCSGFGTLVQMAAAGGVTVTLAAAPTIGNTLIWAWAGRVTNGTSLPPDSGSWTLIRREFSNANGIGGAGPTALYYKPVESGDTATFGTITSIFGGNKAYLIEFGGQLIPDDDNGATQVYGVDPTVTLTPTPGKVALLISFANAANDDAFGFPSWATPAAGMTEVFDTGVNAPDMALNTRLVTSTSGSYTVGSSGYINPYGGYAAVVAASFVCTGTDNPPMRGQWVGINPPEYVTMTGDSGTTQYPFADGSLHVFVDDTNQTSKLIAQDGTTGDFQLGFTPTPTEVVTVQYMGR